MGLFGSKKEGGIMDVIRCDQSDYLIWKWTPAGMPSRKMNAIRYGSRLRVKEGEVAVFVYEKEGGMDFIEGFHDEVLKTANFPVLTTIVGAAFGGQSPFQAEVFFINRSGTLRLPFFIENVTLSEARHVAVNQLTSIETNERPLFVPASVKGSLTFSIADYKAFIAKYQMAQYDMNDLSLQIRDALRRHAKSYITKATKENNISLVEIEGYLDQISEYVEEKLKEQLKADFAIDVRRIDISDIMLDTSSMGYKELMAQTAVASEAEMRNIRDKQRIAAEHNEEMLRIAREGQLLGQQEAHIRAHQINIQGEVARTAAESLGYLGGDGSNAGMNPAGMMTGVMMGGVVGNNMANMMGNMMQDIQKQQTSMGMPAGQAQPNNMGQPVASPAAQGIPTPPCGPATPPPPPQMPQTLYFVAENGAQTGPFTSEQLRQMILNRQVGPATYVWKQGMAAWAAAASLPELSNEFGTVPPPINM